MRKQLEQLRAFALRIRGREGYVLRPSKSNPRVKRWMKRPQDQSSGATRGKANVVAKRYDPALDKLIEEPALFPLPDPGPKDIANARLKYLGLDLETGQLPPLDLLSDAEKRDLGQALARVVDSGLDVSLLAEVDDEDFWGSLSQALEDDRERFSLYKKLQQKNLEDAAKYVLGPIPLETAFDLAAESHDDAEDAYHRAKSAVRDLYGAYDRDEIRELERRLLAKGTSQGGVVEDSGYEDRADSMRYSRWADEELGAEGETTEARIRSLSKPEVWEKALEIFQDSYAASGFDRIKSAYESLSPEEQAALREKLATYWVRSAEEPIFAVVQSMDSAKLLYDDAYKYHEAQDFSDDRAEMENALGIGRVVYGVLAYPGLAPVYARNTSSRFRHDLGNIPRGYKFDPHTMELGNSSYGGGRPMHLRFRIPALDRRSISYSDDDTYYRSEYSPFGESVITSSLANAYRTLKVTPDAAGVSPIFTELHYDEPISLEYLREIWLPLLPHGNYDEADSIRAMHQYSRDLFPALNHIAERENPPEIYFYNPLLGIAGLEAPRTADDREIVDEAARWRDALNRLSFVPKNSKLWLPARLQEEVDRL